LCGLYEDGELAECSLARPGTLLVHPKRLDEIANLSCEG
jgi:hypothetical protein